VTGIGTQFPQTSTSEIPISVRIPADTVVPSHLTNRETQVLRLMADGLTTKEIAVQLNVRFKTAACHRSRILQKLNVTSTVTAVRWAIRVGIVAV